MEMPPFLLLLSCWLAPFACICQMKLDEPQSHTCIESLALSIGVCCTLHPHVTSYNDVISASHKVTMFIWPKRWYGSLWNTQVLTLTTSLHHEFKERYSFAEGVLRTDLQLLTILLPCEEQDKISYSPLTRNSTGPNIDYGL